MDWKKHGLQLVSLALNVILLILLLGQGNHLEQLEASIQDVTGSLSAVSLELEWLRGQVDSLQAQLREGEQLIADYTLEPTGLDTASRALLADVVLQLKAWGADSTVDLMVTTGGREVVQALPVDAAGACRGQVAIPLEGDADFSLAAQVTSGGVTAREELGIWHGIAALLPLRQGGTSVGGPSYLGGVMSCETDICVEQNGQAQVREPMFRAYRNQELALEIPAEISQDMSSSSGDCYAPAQALEIACSPGDTVTVTFFCRDSYGLGYAFSIGSWAVEANASVSRGEGTLSEPVLTWPE